MNTFSQNKLRITLSNLIVSVSFIMAVVSALLLSVPTRAQAMGIFLDIPEAPLRVGNTSLLHVLVDTDEREINAIEGIVTIAHPSSVSALTTGGSIFNLWPRKPSLVAENISFTGGTTAGVFGGSLRVFTIAVTPKNTDPIRINFSGITAFLNDGKGTSVPVLTAPVTIQVSPADGSGKKESELAGLILSDTTPPEPFAIDIGHDPSLFDGKYFLSFYTTDSESGIDRYEVTEGDFPMVRSGSVYVLQNQRMDGTVEVKAIDNAGNARVQTLDLTARMPWIMIIFTVLILFILALLGYMFIIRKTVSIGMFVALLVVFASPARSFAADLYLIFDKSQVAEYGTLSGTVYVSTGGVPINNAESTIHFPTDLLTVESVNTSGSIFNIWVEQPSFSNTAGTIYFNGGLPTPGYSGQSGNSLRINFRAKKAGVANLSFGTSAVRANDGSGTNVLSQTRGATVSINAAAPVPVADPAAALLAGEPGTPKAPTITSDDIPDQNAWYNKTDALFSWQLPSDVTAVQLVLSKSPSTVPTITYDPPIKTKNLTSLSDGILYLNARFKNSVGWGKISSRKIQIDTTEPTNITVTSEIGADDVLVLEAQAKDALSGIARFEVYKHDEKIREVTANTSGPTQFDLPILDGGKHTLVVRAYDKAANYAQTQIDVDAPEIAAPRLTHYPEYIKIGSRLELRGKSPYAQSDVVIWIKIGDKEPTSHIVKSDEDKIFTFESSPIEDLGVVSIWAEALRGQDAKSAPSEKIYVNAQQSDAAWIGTRAIEFTSLAVTLLVLILALVGLVYVGVRKINTFKRRLRRDLMHTQQEVHKVFEMLKSDTKRHVKMLEKASAKRKLTKEESKLLEELSENLDETEAYLEEKIRDVGSKKKRAEE